MLQLSFFLSFTFRISSVWFAVDKFSTAFQISQTTSYSLLYRLFSFECRAATTRLLGLNQHTISRFCCYFVVSISLNASCCPLRSGDRHKRSSMVCNECIPEICAVICKNQKYYNKSNRNNEWMQLSVWYQRKPH